MYPKYLFLDFDGVLHSATRPGVVFTQVQLLEQALAGSTCQLIISSSWRFHYPLEELKQMLPDGLAHRVVGRTGPALAVKHARYQEIKVYLDQRGKSLANWRALDDAVLEFPKDCEHLILCNPNTGMTQVQVQAVSDWLNAKGSFK
jgi:hypothetical protein